MRKAAHGRDVLGRQVVLSGAVETLGRGLAHAVDALVGLGAVVVPVLPRAGHGERNARRVPRADARDLAPPAVRLAWQPRHAPAVHHALGAVALRHADHVDVFLRREDARHRDLLLEETQAEVHLRSRAAPVYLDLHDVGFFKAFAELGGLLGWVF